MSKWIPSALSIVLSLSSLFISILAFNRSHITQRAYIGVDAEVTKQQRPGGQEEEFVTAKMRITGASPAHDIISVLECGVYPVNKTIPPPGKRVPIFDPYVSRNTTKPLQGIDAVPGEILTIGSCFPQYVTEITVTKGIISYRDELNSWHYKKYCFEYVLRTLRTCNAGNDAN